MVSKAVNGSLSTKTRERGSRASGGARDALPPATATRRVAWVLAVGAWLFVLLSLASFDSADPPSHVVAVHNSPVANLCGRFGAALAYWSYYLLGYGGWMVLLTAAIYLAITVSGRGLHHLPLRLMGIVFMAAAVSSGHAVLWPTAGPLTGAEPGLLAQWIAGHLVPRFSTGGSILIILFALGMGAVVAIDQVVFALPRWIGVAIGWSLKIKLPRPALPRVSMPSLFRRRSPRLATSNGVPVDQEDLAELSSGSRRTRRGIRVGHPVIDADAGGIGATESFDPDLHEVADDNGTSDDDAGVVAEENRKASGELDPQEPVRQRLTADQLREKIAKLPVRLAGMTKTVARDEDIPRQENYDGYQFPPLELLADPETNYSAKMEAFVRNQAHKLESSLHTYDIDGEVVGIESGPVVTLYSVQLAPGTKVAKVSAIASDLARSLSAQNIRIVANTAGKTTVGIEVPNLQKERVRLKELMSGGHAEKMVLPMFLGKDVSGEPLVADLTRMPHMLIAGTTGSGKSVCINTIIMSWLYTKRPDELKLVLVDPKMVELSQFADIPHLMCPVVTESAKAAAILEWAVTKMEERYELLREAMVRDIAGYNALTDEEKFELFKPANDGERAKIPKRLPYIVFVIDELADLVLTCKEAEHSIVRIAQKARAVGIHLILATQRPQANVVTGLIKSNMPCRVSFKVASGMDSRIVLDQKGAELLLGQGDMLFLTPHTSEVKRAQGTLVTDTETRKVASFLKNVAAPNYERALLAIRPGMNGENDAEGLNPTERDPLFDEAVEIMIETGRGSVSLLQRRLAIGYSRASRLVDQMGLAGILGEHKGSVAREVLITLDEWHEMKRLEEEAVKNGTVFQDSQDDDAMGEMTDPDPDGVAPEIQTIEREQERVGAD